MRQLFLYLIIATVGITFIVSLPSMFNFLYSLWSRKRGIAHKDKAIVERNARALSATLSPDSKIAKIQVAGFNLWRWNCWRPMYRVKIWYWDELWPRRMTRACDHSACSHPDCKTHRAELPVLAGASCSTGPVYLQNAE